MTLLLFFLSAATIRFDRSMSLRGQVFFSNEDDIGGIIRGGGRYDVTGKN
ncbi:MAG: hypothetical protein IJ650_03400 [Paludibacteraceae bacterium]|nr:hypothetical protein [Paludibacteraceae bacterium]